MNIRLSVLLWLVLVSFQNLAMAAIRCANADLSRLTKAVYVSPQGNDVGGCGQSTASPCKTIQQGIASCSAENCGVLVRYGTYSTDKPITLADGVSLYGSCVFDETAYRYRSTIIGNPAVQANGINKATVLEGFVVLGSAGVQAGEASVALAVRNSTGLVLRENVIASGPGGKGGNGGTPPASTGQTGRIANDITGGAGGLACPSNPPLGSIGNGGKGANLRPITSTCYVFFCSCDDRREAPSPVGENGTASASALGGVGGRPGTPGCACSVSGKIQDNAGSGLDGGSGNIGAAASGGGGSPNRDTKGSFAGTTWQPNLGDSGAAGQVGSGGGGGGAGGFAALPKSGTNTNGYPGGGGGGGGCGGPGGTGAQQGGVSVPLVLFASSVAGLEGSNALIPGPGGRGGQGGTGAPGGIGGSGGPGYRGPQKFFEQGANGIVCKGNVPGFGGRGGDGGPGGAGAGGAGGNGGPSFGIALVNSSSVTASHFTIYNAQPGTGGDGGTGGQNGATNKGGDGKAGSPGYDQSLIVSFTSTNLSVRANQ